MKKDRICSIIVNSRAIKKTRRRVNYILNKKLKFYTKEIFKFFSITLIAFGFIIAMICIKYKPVYAVSISGEQVGYVQNEKDFNKEIEENIENYSAKNVDSVTLEAKPEYELKFVNKSEETNEDSILIAMQREMKITYKYYDILLNNEKIDSVDTMEEAQKIVNSLQEQNSKGFSFTIAEKVTENPEEISTNDVEVAKTNVSNVLSDKTEQKIKEEEAARGLANVNGIKIAVLPVTGTISSRYGVTSRIRVSTHTGLDIAATTGTPIKAVSDGTVISAGWAGSYGYLVKASHGNGVETWYGHTSKMYVSAGESVKAGDVIAAVGSTGNSTGPHLHFEIRINGETVNPQNYIYN